MTNCPHGINQGKIFQYYFGINRKFVFQNFTW